MPHLIMDYHLQEPASLDMVREWLDGMVSAIEMTPIAPQLLIEHEGVVHGFQVIAESHICAEIRGQEAHLDVFSCKEFDVPQVIALSALHFQVEAGAITFLRDRLDLEAME